MSEFSIDFPHDGDVLSRHDGKETSKGLKIVVRGRCGSRAAVKVAGKPARVSKGRFEAKVLLTNARNEIAVACGGDRRSLTVLYDRCSFPRYRFSVDDTIWCFTEVGRNADRYKSLFDHWFFAFFRKLHNDFSAQIQVNIYFEDPEAGFDLTQFPDRWKSEWQDNADWLRLSFHARGDKCYNNRIYRDISREQFIADYNQVIEQILRFAGEPTLCRSYTTTHWAEISRAGGEAMPAVGLRGLTGRFGVDHKDRLYSTHYYLDDEVNRHCHTRNMWYDKTTDLYFVNCPQFLNNVPVAMVPWHYDRLVDGAGGRSPFDVIDFLVHEEHFWKGFLGGRGYKADNMERCIVAALWATERGLTPVCFEKGIAGNET